MATGGMHPHPEALYYHVALNALHSARTETDEFRRKQLIATTLVFSALCLEAFINQEYARHSETKKIIEEGQSLGLETKWLMFPLLLGQPTTFDKAAGPFQVFHNLINIRNQRLVHFKPPKETQLVGEQYPKQYFGDLLNDLSLAEQCLSCAGHMIRELNRLAGGRTDVPKFLSGDKYLSTVWASAQPPYEST